METKITLQYNALTGIEYEGGRNQAELINYKLKMKFKSDGWVTFLQAKQMGLSIKRGAKSAAIFKGFKSFDEENDDGKIKTVSRPVGFARVFNLDQTKKED